eukprot:13836978-Alexandrium_andersonii.AAC.1
MSASGSWSVCKSGSVHMPLRLSVSVCTCACAGAGVCVCVAAACAAIASSLQQQWHCNSFRSQVRSLTIPSRGMPSLYRCL